MVNNILYVQLVREYKLSTFCLITIPFLGWQNFRQRLAIFFPSVVNSLLQHEVVNTLQSVYFPINYVYLPDCKWNKFLPLFLFYRELNFSNISHWCARIKCELVVLYTQSISVCCFPRRNFIRKYTV